MNRRGALCIFGDVRLIVAGKCSLCQFNSVVAKFS